MQKTNRRTLLKNALLPMAGLAGLPSLSAAVQAASTPFNRPKLKITEIRTAEVRVHGYQVHVRVHTDQGIVGQGESTDAAVGGVPLMRSVRGIFVYLFPHSFLTPAMSRKWRRSPDLHSGSLQLLTSEAVKIGKLLRP